MLEEKQKIITASELKAYLNSLEKEQEREKAKRIHEYKQECNIRDTKVKKRELIKIEKAVDKEYVNLLKLADEILELLDECRGLPTDIENLQIAEYMLYRVDIRKAEKIINKVTKKLEKRYEDIKSSIENKMIGIPVLENIESVDYTEYNVQEDSLAKSKEQYKLQYTEEERRELIQKDLDIIEQVRKFNSVPIPHEILKNSDRDIQSKMQKFNSIRQKRIRILDTMQTDYERLLDPREILCMIDDAVKYIEKCEYVLTKSEYNSVKNILNRRKRRVNRSTNDVRSIIETKEKKTGITNFNIQQARYLRMENLRDTITNATNLIKENPIEELQEQLEKLKISYEREKQFASVIENLNDGQGGNNAEVKAYEEQINSLQYRLINSKRIVSEEEDKIRNAKKELLVLWKMEINAAVSKKSESLALPMPKRRRTREEQIQENTNVFKKLKKVSRRKTCYELKLSIKCLYMHMNVYRGAFMLKLKRILSIVLFISIIFAHISVFADDNLEEDIEFSEIDEIAVDVQKIPEINSKYAIAYDRISGNILYGKKENERCKMASTTKIMSALIVLENVENLEAKTKVSVKAAGTGGSRLGLHKDDEISIKDLLYGLLLCSRKRCSSNPCGICIRKYRRIFKINE